jgi:hypothetical protein
VRNIGKSGGLGRIRTGVHGFAIRCVASPPRDLGRAL